MTGNVIPYFENNLKLSEAQARMFLAEYLSGLSNFVHSLGVREIRDIGKAVFKNNGSIEFEVHISHERELTDAQLLDALVSKRASYENYVNSKIDEIKQHELNLLCQITKYNQELQLALFKCNLQIERLYLECPKMICEQYAYYENLKQQIMADELQTELILCDKIGNAETALNRLGAERIKYNRKLEYCISDLRYLARRKVYIITVSKK